MKLALLKTVILALLFGEIILNRGYGMEQNSHHSEETITPQIIRSHKMLSPVEEVVFIPPEVSKQFLNAIYDDEDIAAFWATCKAWKIIGDSYYKQKNKEQHIFPWKECPQLPPRILNRLNTDYLFLLGMHKNVLFYDAAKSDRTRFEVVCEHIQNTPFLPKKSLIKSFAELLQLYLYNNCPTDYQDNTDILSFHNSIKKSEIIIDNKIVKVGFEVSKIRNQENISFQNEIVLYFYFSSFFNKNNRGIGVIRKDRFFKILTCNLFDVIKNHDRLRDLQRIRNKTKKLWREQIELDCAPTFRDYYDVGWMHAEKGRHQEAIDYYKMAEEAEQQGRVNRRYLYLLVNFAASLKALKNYQGAAHHYDQYFIERLLQPEVAKNLTFLQLDPLISAAFVQNKLGNMDKEANYLSRINEIKTAETVRQAEAKEKDMPKADEALLRTKAHKRKKGKKEKNS